MTYTQLYLLIAAIFVARHANREVAYLCAAMYIIGAIVINLI